MRPTTHLPRILRGAAAALGAALLLTVPALAQDAAVDAARALLPAKYRDAGVLNVSASTVYAPHSFFKEGTTEFTGYEIELFNEVTDILGVKPVYTEAPFQQLIAGITSGRSDVSLGDLGDNDLRREQVDFIDHSRLTFQLLIGEGDKEKFKSVFDLCGQELGLVQGTTNIISKTLSQCEAKGLKPTTYVEFPDATAKDQAIQSGRLPRADVQATAVGRYRAANGLSQGLVLVPAPELGDLYIGWIVEKGNTGLANAIEAALKILFENGKYAEILAKYDIADLNLSAPGVNIGQNASNWVQPKPKS
ncbi:transporter substrate-binding domain-containing protein [Devosia sp. ZB163]|uniref:transporter substrate-binding domain-containing protein n=1 Tax=Devosia sp. ZB163 TaxID=3025938 RepID=UPI0023606BDE|nr:transporter substrate-binding domain-containing protein [Devosia sp. ZB163]MDC9826245.1 transporter substrate-binding domain-containing protein [Devosia sp. ZB163]